MTDEFYSALEEWWEKTCHAQRHTSANKQDDVLRNDVFSRAVNWVEGRGGIPVTVSEMLYVFVSRDLREQAKFYAALISA